VSRALRRLALVPPTLLGITLVTFALVHLAPGDPAALRAGVGRGVTEQVIAENRRLAGLDRPLLPRYASWLGRSARLDFGASLVDGRPVRARVGEALPRTALLALAAALLAFGVAVPLGAFAARRDGTRVAAALEAGLAILYGLPSVAMALLLLRAGAPYGGEGMGALLAPAACLALPSSVTLARYQRGALLEVLHADFIRTARAKGASERAVLFGHALRNALLPMVTLLGAQVPALLSGSVVVEQVFGVRGLGLLGYQAVLARDYPTLMALTTLGALFTLGGVLVADAAYGLLDPRLRAEEAR
jgi:peptide/nickel transport system permease protein